MLSATGRDKTAAAARGLKAMGCAPQRIVSSPLIRARETAEIVATVLGVSAKIEEDNILSTASYGSNVVAWLSSQPRKDTMLVGHQPTCSEVVSLLLTATDDVDVVFKKAATCCMSFEGTPLPGEGWLEWMLQPRMLRELGG
jgi:phosphohistidine phosphatase